MRKLPCFANLAPSKVFPNINPFCNEVNGPIQIQRANPTMCRSGNIPGYCGKGFKIDKNRVRQVLRRRVSSVVEHSSANPKVPGSFPGVVAYRGHGL